MFLPIFCRCNIIKYIINISLHSSYHLWPFFSLSDQTTNQKEVSRAELSCIIRCPGDLLVSFGFQIEFKFIKLEFFFFNYLYFSTIFKRKNVKYHCSVVTIFLNLIISGSKGWQLMAMMTADYIISHYCHEMA